MTGRLGAIFFLALVIVGGAVYLIVPAGDAARLSEPRRTLFQAAALRAEPLIGAIAAYSEVTGHPPQSLADLVPTYLDRLPATGLEICDRFEYRLLPDRQAQLVWYDLGSRQGRPWSGTSHYSEGDPEHAILVFTLDAENKISSALIDRAPKDIEAEDFEPTRWKAGQGRMEMAPTLAETYRLYGMPRTVFEELLGTPDRSKALDRAPWELRINCPSRLLNRDALVYWPTERYPEHLYGGRTEALGTWIYLHT